MRVVPTLTLLAPFSRMIFAADNQGVPASEGESQSMGEIQTTTLSNGMRVVSRETHRAGSVVNLFVDAGSSREDDMTTAGASHFLQHLAFHSTESRSAIRMTRDLEHIGASASGTAAREHMKYSVSCLRGDVGSAIELLGDTACNSTAPVWEVPDVQNVVAWDVDEVEGDAQEVLSEMMHAAAYGETAPLGRPLYCPRRALGTISSDVLNSFTAAHYTAPRFVLSAAGVDHGELVKLAETHFASLGRDAGPAHEDSPYIGGDSRLRAHSALTHVALAFDAGGLKDDLVASTGVLQLVLGGGGSLSAGGPGRGVQSRLAQAMASGNLEAADSATAFTSLYGGGGLVGVYGTSNAQSAGSLAEAMGAEVCKLAGAAPADDEVQRAKNQLKASVLMNCETSDGIADDLGRQVLVHGAAETPASICASIDAVSASSVQKAAQKAVASPVTVAAFGDVSAIPPYNALAGKFK